MDKTQARAALRQDEHFLREAYSKAALASMLSIISGCVNLFADGIIVGHRFGVDGLTALSLSVPINLALCVVGSFIVSGTAICAASEIGKGRMSQAQKFYGSGLSLCLISSIVATVGGLWILPFLVRAFSPDPAVRQMVFDYGGVTLAGALPKILLYIPFWYLRLEGKNSFCPVMMAVMGGGNALLDLVFLYGMGMGIFGAGLASVIATSAACVLGLIRLHVGLSNFTFRFQFLTKRKEWKRVASAGGPMALNNAMQTLKVLVANQLLFRFGGNEMVAVFTAVNGMTAFAESVTLGIPQAGSAMLGVFHGERDCESSKILIRQECRSGGLAAVVFGVFVVVFSDAIRMAYGLGAVSLTIPLACLAISVFPGLWNCILIYYYSVAGHGTLADVMVVCRVFLFSVASLAVLGALSLPVWLFLPMGEALTALFWWWASKVISSKKQNLTRYFLMDETLEKSGQVINFTLPGVEEDICSACDRISDFCARNGMGRREYYRVSLSMEELMTLIVHENKGTQVSFDVRVFSVRGVVGIRIRYGGKYFDPIHSYHEDNDAFLGYSMIAKLVTEVAYRKVFGVNTLLVLL